MKDSISARTRVCGVIGNPVEHSMSPAMHNAAFRELGLDYVYVAFRVLPENVVQAISGMKALGLRGLNVTLPHKVAVMPLLDEIDPAAQAIEAVNTIVNDNGKLTGYNTDAPGFLRPLLERGIDIGGKNVLILGAGGASRAVAYVLAEKGARITILNRHKERAEALADRINAEHSGTTTALELNDENLNRQIENAEILVNVTSVGMSPNVSDSLVKPSLLRRGVVVYDTVYTPVKTRLLRDAEAAGADVISGIEMLTWQGAIAFELFTGEKAPLELMKSAAIKQLQGVG